MNDVVFAISCLLTIACALGVVFAKNPIYSAFSLILSFFCLSGVYVLWGSPFIAMIQVLIYTGAIVVLFVFVVMLLELVKAVPSASNPWMMVSAAGVAIWFVSLLLLRTLNRGGNMIAAPNSSSALDIRSISKLLFTDYLWAFELLGVFLLVMVIAVHIISRPEESSENEGGAR